MAGNPSRRALLRGGLLAGAGVGAGAVAGGFAGHAIAGERPDPPEPFLGTHQAGIVTTTQRQTVLAAFDLSTSARGDLIALLKSWTSLAAKLAAGESVTVPIYTGGSGSDAYADATGDSTTDDSFEAYGLGTNRIPLPARSGRSLLV